MKRFRGITVKEARSLKIEFQFTRCSRHFSFLKLPLPLSLSLLTGYLNSGPYQFAILFIFIFTAVVLISCIGSFIIFRQWAPIIKIRSSLLRTLTMFHEETYIAMWFNLREGSSIKKIIKKQCLMKIAWTNRYRRQSKNLNQSLE